MMSALKPPLQSTVATLALSRHNFGQQAAYMSTFAKILKDEPF